MLKQICFSRKAFYSITLVFLIFPKEMENDNDMSEGEKICWTLCGGDVRTD
jgi:hypothetical protein